MTCQIKALVRYVQETDWQTEAGQQHLNQLIDWVLRTRRFCRRSSRSGDCEVVAELNQALRSQLYQDLAHSLTQAASESWGTEEWRQAKRRQTYRAVLNNAWLTRLASTAQQCPAESERRRQALLNLVEAIRLSEKLTQRTAYSPTYAEAVNQTLVHVYEHIDQYRAQDYPVMAWVNYWLGIHLRQTQKAQADPLAQASMAKLVRTKIQLRQRVKTIQLASVHCWLRFGVKGKPFEQNLPPVILWVLVSCLWLSQQIHQNSRLADTCLFELAKEMVAPIHMTTPNAENSTQDFSQTNLAPYLSDEIRHYLATDPDGLLQAHIRGKPEATFQVIALAYMDGVSWKALSKRLGVPVPSLSSFFQRQLEKVAPNIRHYLQH